MGIEPTDRDAKKIIPANLKELIYHLRLKGRLGAIWKAGDWIDEHFEQAPARKGEVEFLSAALQKSVDGSVPVSVSHLQKCRQFRLEWEMNEVEIATEVGLPWRRAFKLTVIKRLAIRLVEKSPERAAKIQHKWNERLKSFPGSKKSKELSAWVASVEELKVESQADNPGISKIQERLWVGCWEAAVFRLDGAAAQIDKMSALLSDEKSKRYAVAARTNIIAAQEKLRKFYTPPKPKSGSIGESGADD